MHDASFQHAVETLATALTQVAEGGTVRSYWNTGRVDLLGRNRHTALVLFRSNAERLNTAEALTADVRAAVRGAALPDGFRTWVTGTAPAYFDLDRQSAADLLQAERIGIPVTLIILLVLFRAPIAAGLPLVMALTAVAIGSAALYLLSFGTSVSVFSRNVVSMIGLGLGVDYALFMLASFRRALSLGHRDSDAVAFADAGCGAYHPRVWRGRRRRLRVPASGERAVHQIDGAWRNGNHADRRGDGADALTRFAVMARRGCELAAHTRGPACRRSRHLEPVGRTGHAQAMDVHARGQRRRTGVRGGLRASAALEHWRAGPLGADGGTSGIRDAEERVRRGAQWADCSANRSIGRRRRVGSRSAAGYLASRARECPTTPGWRKSLACRISCRPRRRCTCRFGHPPTSPNVSASLRRTS